MTDRVINAAERFTKKPLPSEATVDPLWTRGNPNEFRSMFLPSVKALPFVSEEWKNEYWPECMWVDEPTDDYCADMDRGRHFARLTISALMADRPKHGVALEKIFEAIVNDAIRRRAKAGKGSRSLPAAVRGYLDQLAEFIASECRQVPQAPA
jgi:hypothetical protein